MPRYSENALVQQDVEAAHGRIRLVPRSQWWRVAGKRACRHHGGWQRHRCDAVVGQRLGRLSRVTFGNSRVDAAVALTVGVDAFGRANLSMPAVVGMVMRVLPNPASRHTGNRAGTRGPCKRHRDGKDGRDNGISPSHGPPYTPHGTAGQPRRIRLDDDFARARWLLCPVAELRFLCLHGRQPDEGAVAYSVTRNALWRPTLVALCATGRCLSVSAAAATTLELEFVDIGRTTL